jgi:hypothetical protein
MSPAPTATEAITCEELAGALRELANRTGNGNAYFPALAADIFRHVSGRRASLSLAAAQEPHAAAMEQAASEADSPLTHFFHCWRFPDHHACAVALIERQGEEIDQQLVRAATAERELAELRRAAAQDRPECAALGERRHG